MTISGDSGLVYPNSSSQANALVGFKNRVIDGGFIINQRGYVSNTALSSGSYGHDRWKAGSGGCTYTFTQGSTGVNTTITITAGTLQQVIEGCNVPEGGTYTLSWTGTATARFNSGSYAASPVTVTGITAGANTTIEFGTGTVGSVQVEAGSTASSFDYRPYGTELALCQRYFWKTYNASVVPGAPGANQAGSVMIYVPATGNTVRCTMPFKVNMRAAPTMTVYNPETGTAGYGAYEGSGATNQVALGLTFISEYSGLVYATSAGFTGSFYWQAKGEAEL